MREQTSAIYQAAAVAYNRRYRRSSTEDRPQFALTAPIGLSEARRLAHVLDSLVRVSRRDGQSTDTVHRDPRKGGTGNRRPSKSSRPGESPNTRHRSDDHTRRPPARALGSSLLGNPEEGHHRQRPACDTYCGQDVGPGARRSEEATMRPVRIPGQFDLRLSARL